MIIDNEPLSDSTSLTFPSIIPGAYREAFSSKKGVIDIFEMDAGSTDFAEQWVSLLYQKQEKPVVICPDGIASKKIEHLFFSARNYEKIKGYKALGFGYPLLAKKDRNASSGLLTAPLFIWEVHISPDADKENTWMLTLKNNSKVRINPFLAGLSPDLDTLLDRYQKKIATRGLTAKLSRDFCAQLAEQLSCRNDPPDKNVYRFPDIEDLVTMEESGSIVWSGVFSFFPPVHQYKISEGIFSREYWKESVPEAAVETPFKVDLLSCDHHQKAAHLAAVKNKFVVIEGGSGTGKGHTICNLLINNLLNGQKTLVVAQTVVELEKIFGQFNETGFGSQAFLFKNPELDRDILIDQLIARADNTLKAKKSPASGFPLNYFLFDTIRDRLDHFSQKYAQNVFDINSWTDTVGLLLESRRISSEKHLDPYLSALDFDFDLLEYEQIVEKIEECHILFKNEFSFYHPLDELKEQVFALDDPEKGQNEIRNQLRTAMKKARAVQYQYQKVLRQYKIHLEDYYGGYFQQNLDRLNQIYSLVDQLHIQYGSEYDTTSVQKIKLLKSFSEKNREVFNFKTRINDEFDRLQSEFGQQKIFDFEFQELEDPHNIRSVTDQLDLFRKALMSWQEQIPGLIQEQVNKLNGKTFHPAMPGIEQITDLEAAYDILIQEVNQNDLFTEPLKNNAMTLQLRQQLLDELIEKISRCLFYLKEFGILFPWKKMMFSLEEKEKKVINALLRVKPDNWKACFDSWFFHHLLYDQHNPDVDFEKLFREYEESYRRVKEQVPSYINSVWRERRKKSIQQLKKSRRKELSGFLKKAGSKEDFIVYNKKYFQYLSSFFPVLLMTMDSAREMLPTEKKAITDNLIFLEGTRFSKEQGGSLLELTRKVQVFSTGVHGFESGAHSFWNLALLLAGKHVFLRYQHRTTAVPLMIFNNAALDQQQLIAYHKINEDPNTMVLYQVNGLYDDEEKINDDECRYMLSLLKDIKRTPQHTYPKVGFACATEEQRDQFASYLLKIKQRKDQGGEKIRQLERNGMGVFSFAELSGQQFDLLVVSFTYGVVNEAGDLLPVIPFIQGKDQKILKAIISSCSQKLIMCNSIPISMIRKYQHNEQDGNWDLFAQLIDYTSALEQNKPDRLNEIIDYLREVEKGPKQVVPDLFIRQVALLMASYFEEGRIQIAVPIRNQLFPLVIKGNTPQLPAYILYPDPFIKKTDTYSYFWEKEVRQDLEREGYRFLNIWSRKWWKNPEAEARKLASRIIQEDATFAKPAATEPEQKEESSKKGENGY